MNSQHPDFMLIEQITTYLDQEFDGLQPTRSWGELSFFYNPRHQLPRGTYFCTIKEKDGENDRASDLDRPDVYRLNFGLPKLEFDKRFGQRPDRPPKGGVVNGPWDFSACDVIMPHPVYGWMGWVCVLNPQADTFEICKPMLALAYQNAISGFRKRMVKHG